MAKKIFIIGAGRSASSLIKYLINSSEENDYVLIIGDKDVSLVKDKIDGHKCATAIRFDVLDLRSTRRHLRSGQRWRRPTRPGF